MQIRITGRHLEITPAMHDYAEKKVASLKKYFDHILEAHVILKVEKNSQCCEIKMPAEGFSLYSEETGDDLYASIDKAVGRMERQLIKIKEKTKSKNHKDTRELEDMIAAQSSSVAAVSEEQRVTKVDRLARKPMSVKDAVVLLNENKNLFLVFINSEDDQMNVVYRRLDGSFGLIAKD